MRAGPAIVSVPPASTRPRQDPPHVSAQGPHLGCEPVGQPVRVDAEPLDQRRHLRIPAGAEALADHLQASAEDVDGDGTGVGLGDGADAGIATEETASAAVIDKGRALVGTPAAPEPEADVTNGTSTWAS